MAQRSPITASETGIPRTVRFSPNAPGPSVTPSCVSHQSVSWAPCAETAWSGPPWTVRSAWSSPSRLTPRTGTRPATGAFQIAVRTVCPPTSTSRGRPTLTDSTVPVPMGPPYWGAAAALGGRSSPGGREVQRSSFCTADQRRDDEDRAVRLVDEPRRDAAEHRGQHATAATGAADQQVIALAGRHQVPARVLVIGRGQDVERGAGGLGQPARGVGGEAGRGRAVVGD